MSNSDAARWNKRFREEVRNSSFERPRPFLVENAAYLPRKGLALDIAMGLGGNAGFLIERGMQVVGIDISSVAVQRAKERLPSLMAVQADLSQLSLPPATFDVILNFYFLQRNLWSHYLHALRPGGWLVFETLTQEFLTIQPEVDPEYLLAPGELSRAFPLLETVVYHEGWSLGETRHARPVASLLTRAPRSENDLPGG
jgi:tellurite methyltransferase